MKKNSIHILIVTSVALCAGATLPFLFGHSTIDPEQQSVKSEVPYCVTSPSVPDKIAFAGQEKALLEMTLKKANLEDIFLELTEHSQTAGEPAESEAEDA